MALFKFGKSAAVPEGGGRSRRRQAADSQESLEAISRRAHYRLLGAALLVGAAVIGLPMLFDKQPRVVQVDAQFSIPDKGDVAPLHVSSTESLDAREEFVAPKSEAAVPAASQPAVAEPASPPVKEDADAREKERREQQVKAEQERQQQAKAKAEKKRQQQQQVAKAKAEKERKEQQAKAEKERQQQAAKAKAEKERKEQQAKAEKERQQQAAKAKAEKERKEQQAKAEKERQQQAKAKAEQERKDKESKAAAQQQRFIVPLGSFPDAQTAHQTRMKAERAGVHTYIQIIKNSAGEERTRVRAGPYNSRQEADKAAATLKGLGLPSTVQPF